MEACSISADQRRTGDGGTSLMRSLGVLLFLFLAIQLRAGLVCRTTAGLEGWVPEAGWFPLVCEVENDGPSFVGVIEITGTGAGQNGYSRVVPLELPTGTHKQISVPVFGTSSYQNQWDVRLKDNKGKVWAEDLNVRARGQVRRNTVLLGAISRSISWTPTFRKILANQPDCQPFSARLQASSLPDNPLLLEGVDALYLNSERIADFRQQQIAALGSWVNCGGHLIVAVEQLSDVNNAAWMRDLIPVQITGVSTLTPGSALEDWLRSPVPRSVMREIASRPGNNSNVTNHPAITLESPYGDTTNDPAFGEAQLPVATGTLRNGGQTVLAVGTTPLIATRPHGNGRVTVLLFSPEREPARSWKNQASFWSRLTEVPPRWYVSRDYYHPNSSGVDSLFGAMIDSRQVRKLPIPWLLLLLVIYLAVIGPLDQFWLRKIGKPMLTWITFPCYVALFSGLIYLVGYKLRAGETEWNELHVVDVFQSGDHTELRGRSFGSIYSPVNQNYTFKSEATATAFRSELAGNWAGRGVMERGEVLQSGNNFTANVYVPVWTSQLYVNDWFQNTGAPFIASVEKTGGGWRATVQNRSDYPLTHLRLVVQGQVFELGEVAARQTRQIPATGTGQPLPSFVMQYGNSFQNTVQQRRSAFGQMEGGRIEDLPNASMAASFVANLNQHDSYSTFLSPATFDLSSAAERDNAILLAWTPDQSPIKPLNQFSPRRQSVNTLWRMTLPVKSTH